MKTASLLCLVISALLVVGGCADQNHSTTATSSQHGLVGPGSVAPVGGGPAGPMPAKQRFEP